MTDPHDLELDAVDRAARAASRSLQAQVDRQIEPELMLAALPPATPDHNRGRLLAAAAIVALFVGSVAIMGDGPSGDERSRLELDEDGNPLPPPQPGVLTALGPNDGRDSIQLPVTVEPNVDLSDGETVTVTGPGFVPGERVGIVQCASEAGEGNGGTREERAGIDACNVGTVQYADANKEGVATGTFKVQRVLSTPATGTVDCALEAQRCIVAMGALGDYDRSGGFGVAFRGGGEPIDIPTMTVTPDEGLTDGTIVHVEGEGFTPGPVLLNLCATDPSGCWSIGEPINPEDVDDLSLGDDVEGAYLGAVGLVADGQGHVSGDVQVWRYLPAPEPGSYIDCAVSTCRLRATSTLDETAPPPPVLGFASGGTGPTPPAIAASPTSDLEPGDDVIVRGAGFEPGLTYSISWCAAPPGAPGDVYACVSPDQGQDRIDPDGGFARKLDVPDLRGLAGESPTTTACATSTDCGAAAPTDEDMCDGIHSVCTIRVEAYTADGPSGGGPPQFPSVPIEITYRA